MAEVAHLFVCLVHRFPMREVTEALAIQNKGFQGCIHGRLGSKRQILLVDFAALERLGVSPGAVKENITTRGLDSLTLIPGQRLRAGKAVFEVTAPCEPCLRMDEIRPGLREELRGQRGWLCKVIESGMVRQGDQIELLQTMGKAAS